MIEFDQRISEQLSEVSLNSSIQVRVGTSNAFMVTASTILPLIEMFDMGGVYISASRGAVEIIEAFECVYKVEHVDDSDGTVCEALTRIKPAFFANGGDRKSDNVPEIALCNNLGIKLLWNIGGDKIQSSSDLVKLADNNAKEA